MEHKQKNKFSLGIIFICLGVLALISSAVWMAYNIWDDNRAAKEADRTARMLIDQVTHRLENTAEQPEDTGQAFEIDGEVYIGVLEIPALQLVLPVNSRWSYPLLKESPCRFSGEIGHFLVIAAHNYKNHFGNVTKLVSGDAVTLTDADGTCHRYSVSQIVTLGDTDMGKMVNSVYDLTLFTCTYGGKARIAVRCEKAS